MEDLVLKKLTKEKIIKIHGLVATSELLQSDTFGNKCTSYIPEELHRWTNLSVNDADISMLFQSAGRPRENYLLQRFTANASTLNSGRCKWELICGQQWCDLSPLLSLSRLGQRYMDEHNFLNVSRINEMVIH
jgi:hypothetical protein